MAVSGFSNEAWLLQSIFHSDKGEGVSLTNLIATGDYINRAIFTLAEINSGIKNLQALGLAEFRQTKFYVLPEARTLFEKLRPRSRSLQKETGLVQAKLLLLEPVSQDWPEADPVNAEDYEKACRAYLGDR